jgi:putative hydrolase of the HAD superfamily
MSEVNEHYRAVIFDFFGVICSEVAPRWTRKRLPAEDVHDIHERFIRDGDTGAKTPEEVYANLAALAGMESSQVKNEWQDLISIDRKVVEFIRALRGRVKLGLCSNAWSDFIRPILKDEDLEGLFDTIVISSEERVAKPDERIFLLAAQRLGVSPQECLFIDDSPVNAAVAARLGMRSIIFTEISDLDHVLA